ncbi:MAG: hypothetical protein ACQKBU_07655, partial [Verrucomicrobiales bacterium]
GWTPLQFRKVWHRTSRSKAPLESLCHMPGRDPVQWTERPHAETLVVPREGNPHTLIVTNARREIVELFQLHTGGSKKRAALLAEGDMTLISRDHAGSVWLVQGVDSKLEKYFITPENHAIAVVT